ncbi:MAG: hypothetical protein ACLUOI_17155 [Eisenbergiella sp.]
MEYSNAYELFDAMKSRLFLQENMHGVYIFTERSRSVFFNVIRRLYRLIPRWKSRTGYPFS